ncbi:hypothetical protein HDU97_008205 [Phlyctochytrium planicorne]|nr:hypothetical protein HDU97_008205 [Phlyctochytrium planicorne]
MSGAEKNAPRGLPSYLTAIPTVPGAGSTTRPGPPMWAPPMGQYPHPASAHDGPSPPMGMYQYPRPPPSFPNYSLPTPNPTPTSPERNAIPTEKSEAPKLQVNIPNSLNVPNSSASKPPTPSNLHSSKIDLDFSSLLRDLQETHEQLLSGKPSSVGASDGFNHQQDIIGDYATGMEDEKGSIFSGENEVSKSMRNGTFGRSSRRTVDDGRSAPESISDRSDSEQDRDSEDEKGSESDSSDDRQYLDGHGYHTTDRPGLRPKVYRYRSTRDSDSDSDSDDDIRRRFKNLQLDNSNQEGPEEIDMVDDDESDDVELALKYPNHAKDVMAVQNVTMDDYKDGDMDGLVLMLDRYMKKSRYSRMIKGDSSKGNSPNLPLPPSVEQKTSPSHVTASPARSPTSEEPMDDLPLAQLQTLHRRKKSVITPVAEESKEPAVSPSMQTPEKEKMTMLIKKLTEANLKKITTRIYIEDASTYETVVLTSLMTADQVIADLIKLPTIEDSPDWTLFELANDLGIERPLREWEIVTDVISAWDTNASVNAILLKKYSYRSTIVAKSIVGRFPKVQGYVYLEVRSKKWQKKFFVLKEGGIYYYKESNLGGETLLCRLSGFDVYTLSREKRRTPTNFCFALRSTSNISIFENKVDYVHFLCVDRQDRLYDWVLAIRLAKNELTFQEFPEDFDDYETVPARDRLASNKEASKDGAQATDTAISPGTLRRKPTALSTSTAAAAFVPAGTTLLGRSIAPKPVEEKPVETPTTPSGTVIPAKPLLSFPTSNINYQQRDRNGPKVSSSRSSAPKTGSSSRSKSVTRPGETAKEREDRHERDRIQRMDDMWEQEQAQMERFMEEERRRLAGSENEKAEPRVRRDKYVPSRRAKQPEGSESPAKVPSSPRKGLERRGSTKEHDRERDRNAAESIPGTGRVGTLGRSRAKPLIDVSGANNCLTCGCSEFKSAHGSRAEMCTNCYHNHKV